MVVYLIGYDLNRPRGEDAYPDLFESIKDIANGWWHHLDSTWIIRSEKSAAQIRDSLMPYVDRNDELLVARLAGEAAWVGFNTNGSDWLRNSLK